MPHSSSVGSYRLGFVKICGITNTADRDVAAQAGADYFGALVDVGYSPRTLSLDQASALFELPPIPGVALLFNADPGRVQAVVERLQPFAVELLGHEPPEEVASLKSRLECQVWKSLHVPARGRGDIDLEVMSELAEEYEDSGADVLVFDTIDSSNGPMKYGGIVGDWGMIRNLARERAIPRCLAGGLNPGNVVQALQTVRPNGIDICSGVESAVGKKDPAKLAALFENLKAYR